jgi:hypothetical protein
MQSVEIRIKGEIDTKWSEWLGGLEIVYTGQNQTLLTGTVVDQPALFSILTKLRDLDLRLVSVNLSDPQQRGRRS